MTNNTITTIICFQNHNKLTEYIFIYQRSIYQRGGAPSAIIIHKMTLKTCFIISNLHPHHSPNFYDAFQKFKKKN